MNPLPARVHIIGIGGSHMSAIARLLLARGVHVTGSDHRTTETTEELRQLGAEVAPRHDATNVGPADLVVYTAAVGETNPEMQEARRRGIPVMIRAEMVARLMEGKRVVAVAGTHGKTTTSTLIALILQRAGHSPMYLLGADSLDLGPNAAWGQGPVCVVEADEFRSAFLEYNPDVAVVTNIDPDHLEYFGTPEAYKNDFTKFIERIRPGGTLLACDDDPGAQAALLAAPARLARETYGMSTGATWYAGNPHFAPDRVIFDVVHQGRTLGELQVGPPGRHMVQNTLAAAAVATAQGVPFETIREAVEGFRGARRRFEYVGETRGTVIIDDYAHHPTEVRAVLSTARARYGGRRFVVVYQPLTYTRIRYLWDDWVNLWDQADVLVVMETFGSREQPQSPGAADLAAAIRRPNAQYAPDVESAAHLAASIVQPGDVLLTVGADQVCEVGPRVLELLR